MKVASTLLRQLEEHAMYDFTVKLFIFQRAQLKAGMMLSVHAAQLACTVCSE